MSVTGAFGKLKSLIGKLQSATAAKLESKEGALMQSALWATREALTECFIYQRDPQGVAWKPRKHVYGDYRDSNPILFDLLSYFRYDVTDGKIKVTNSKYYAFYHQTGTRFMVARRFMPSKARPGSFGSKLKLAGIRTMRSSLGGLGQLWAQLMTRVETSAGQVQSDIERENRR